MPAKWSGELVGEIHNAGLTIKEVAEEAGMNPKYISTVLNSDGDSPKAESKLRAALNRLKGNCEQDLSGENGICGVGSACGGLKVKSMSDVWRDFLKMAAETGMTDGDIYSDNMMCVAYRIYLMGVQDGMKEDATNE